MARALVLFVVHPFLVAGLGDYLYGIWQVLWRFFGYMWAATGRAGQALKCSIANHQNSTEYEEKRRLVGSTLVIWLLFLPLLLTLGGLLLWLLPAQLEVPPELLGLVRLTIALLVANAVLMSLADIPRAILYGENLGYKRLGWSAAVLVSGGGLICLAVHLEMGILGVAGTKVLTTILTGAVFLQLIRRNISWVGILKPSLDNVRNFFGLSGWFMIWKFVTQFMMTGDIIVLGICDSPEAVTTDSLTKYIPDTLTQLVAIVVFSITPGLGGIIGSRQLEKAAKVRNEIMAFTWLLTTTLGATILIWNKSFVQLWVGPKYDAGSIPTLMIVVMLTQLAFILNDANIIDITLRVKSKVLLGALAATLSMISAGLLLSYFQAGIIGLCIGFIISRLILSIGYPWIVGRFLGVSFSSQIKSVLRPAVISVLILTIGWQLRDVLAASNWLGLILFGGITGVSVLLVAFYAGLSVNQQRHLWKRAKRIANLLRGN
ncbi:hypothetical protein IQ260_10710 [Leptolyngbya cf. ectocarpi LEGE 11479]|uniref:Polysaccharide biosynthesis protein n=1 Tax=Leptolyngbya cf. ectocarpi LEGE 11479 TaxID=1828722 RepID=A0A928X4B2_LEPEC|nr:hypothetical protein [Leptolyngbya ectocarpi]MBE9067126.1 hypothetical protein [Leptolyngbya cf. ectocarpi LEGE 11479]